jgi:uncharacterized membrane protein
VRRGYLDWLRGIAVLIMIEAHTLDSWTRVADRGHPVYGWAMVLGGFGAPIFLFLAGVALALAAGSRQRKGATDDEVAAQARRRAWQIFGLAFLFRLQSWLISGGPFSSLLKVDILNVMGLSMLFGALFWGWGRSRWSRAAWLVAAVVAFAMVTPIVREMSLFSPIPDRLEAYFRPVNGRTTFSMFPWAGFLFAGAAIGLWLDTARTPPDERRANAMLGIVGGALALGAYGASYLPAIYHQSSFWTSSPTFFFLRTGVLMLALPVAYAWNALWKGYSPLQDFGRSSLFIYWIHVEMVYGVVSAPIHRQLPFGRAIAAYFAFALFLFLLAKAKDRFGGANLLRDIRMPSIGVLRSTQNAGKR